MVVVFSLLAACCYAVASVLQQRAAAAVPVEYSMRIGLLTRLLARPLWLIGVVADLGGFTFEAIALGLGSLAVVQPLIVLGLPVALALGARTSHQRLGRREWLATGALCVGLFLFLALNTPSRGDDFAPINRWLVVGGSLAAAGAVCLFAASAVPAWRATLLAAATGLVFAGSAALTKSVAALLGNDVLGTLGHWELYGVIIVGILSMLVAQSAFQAGHLRQSLPALTLVPPLVSLAIGQYLFGEDLHVTGPVLAADLVCLVLAAGAVVSLGRSPLAETAYSAV